MEIPAGLYILTFLCCLASADQANDIHLESGFRLQKIEKIFYDSQVIFFYESDLPNFHNFLANVTCDFSPDICNLLDHAKRIAEHTLDTLNHSLPHLDDLTHIKTRRGRAIEWIGDGLNWCCGVGQQTSIDKLAAKHEDLEKFIAHTASQLSEQHDTAVRNSAVINTFMHDMQHVIQQQVAQSNTRFHELADTERIAEEKLIVQSDVISLLLKLIYRVAVNINYLKLLSQCQSGNIPSALIENTVLKRDLEFIETDVEKHGKELSIKPRNIHAYLHLDTSECFFSEKGIIVKVGVPIKAKQNNYELFSVTTLPFLFNDKICTVRLEDNFFLAKNGKEIFPLAKATANRCLSKHICHSTQFSTHFSHDYTCLMLSLSGTATVSAIREACTFTCSKQNLKEPIVIELTSTEFGIIYPNSTISIKCTGKPTQVISTQNQIGIFTIELGCNCSMKVGSRIIKATYPCKRQSVNSVGSVSHHIASSWTFNADEIIISKHTKIRNNYTSVDPNWAAKIHVQDLSTPPLKPYSPSVHQKHAHFFSYSSLIGVLILAIVVAIVIYKGKKILSTILVLLDPTTLMEKIVALLFTRPPVANALYAPEPHEENDYCVLFGAINIILLSFIFLTILLLYITLRRSRVLSLFTKEFKGFDKGKIKLSMINTQKPTQPVRTMTHHFGNTIV